MCVCWVFVGSSVLPTQRLKALDCSEAPALHLHTFHPAEHGSQLDLLAAPAWRNMASFEWDAASARTPRSSEQRWGFERKQGSSVAAVLDH